MYNFLGQFLGMALRCKVAVKVNVPSVFWKGLVGEPLTESDLAAFDESAAQVVSQVRRLRHQEAQRVDGDCAEDGHVAAADDDDDVDVTGGAGGVKGNVDRDDGGDEGGDLSSDGDDPCGLLSGLTWSTRVTGGALVELRPGGAAMAVQPSEARAWAQSVEWARLHEADRALFAIRDGLASVVPAAVLPLLTGEELEAAICGRAEIDLSLLAANTEYDEDVPPDSDHVKRFWRVLESFDHDERAAFLRFVWARSRLPAAADFQQKFKLQGSVGDGPKTSPDSWLPKAHTCFFSLNLPRYSSDEVMAKQLRYAIFNCIEMDADFKLADSEMGNSWEEANDVDEPL